MLDDSSIALEKSSAFVLINFMRFSIPKNDNKYHWTQHCIGKMMFYGLTADRVKRIMRNPKRVEEGVAENTVAVMCPRKIASRSRGKPVLKNEEIWVMYSLSKKASRKIIISAWRYPGISPIGKAIPIPPDVLDELKKW